MSTGSPSASSTGSLYLVVGYDGSPPATRALDAAAGLLRGREGSIDVVYIAYLPAVDTLSADAVIQVEASFDEVGKDLHAQASEQLRGREERWRFDSYQGQIAEALLGAARQLRDAHPGDNVAIVVGSSSQARHRVVGSVAVSLARHASVPVMIVP